MSYDSSQLTDYDIRRMASSSSYVPLYARSTSSSSSTGTSNSSDYDSYYSQLLSANQNSAREQMAFQQYNSDTSHQREVLDLIAAGLNPVLSANNGASTPSGAYANVDSSMLTAKQNAQLQKELTSMNNKNAMDIAKAQIEANKAISKYQTDVGSATSLANAQTAAEASRYASDNSYLASKYASDNSYLASVYGSNTSAYTARNYPNNLYSALASIFGGTSNAKSNVIGILSKFGSLSTNRAVNSSKYVNYNSSAK